MTYDLSRTQDLNTAPASDSVMMVIPNTGAPQTRTFANLISDIISGGLKYRFLHGSAEPGVSTGQDGDVYFRESSPPELWRRAGNNWARFYTFTEVESVDLGLSGGNLTVTLGRTGTASDLSDSVTLNIGSDVYLGAYDSLTDDEKANVDLGQYVLRFNRYWVVQDRANARANAPQEGSGWRRFDGLHQRPVSTSDLFYAALDYVLISGVRYLCLAAGNYNSNGIPNSGNWHRLSDITTQQIAAQIMSAIAMLVKDVSLSGQVMTFTRHDDTTFTLTLPTGGGGTADGVIDGLDMTINTSGVLTVTASRSNNLPSIADSLTLPTPTDSRRGIVPAVPDYDDTYVFMSDEDPPAWLSRSDARTALGITTDRYVNTLTVLFDDATRELEIRLGRLGLSTLSRSVTIPGGGGTQRTLEQLQDAVADMFDTPSGQVNYNDTDGKIRLNTSGIVRVLHLSNQSANRGASDIVTDFDIDNMLIGERVRFYAVWEIITAATGAGGVGEVHLSVSQAGVLVSNNSGQFDASGRLDTGVDASATGFTYVESADYVTYTSTGARTLYIHRPTGASNSDDVRFNLSVYMQRTQVVIPGAGGTNVVANPATTNADPALNSVTIDGADYRIEGGGSGSDDGVVDSVDLSVSNSTLELTLGRSGSLADLSDTVTLPDGGGGTTVTPNPGGSGLGNLNTIGIGDTNYDIGGRYDDLLDRPIFHVNHESDIPTPSSSTYGRRYQTALGHQYRVGRQVVAGTDRVVEFEAYPLVSGAGYQGAFDDQSDVGAPVAGDAGKWYLIRRWLDTASAPFLLVDNNLNFTSVAHIPDADHDYDGRFRTEELAQADPLLDARSGVVYPDAQGREQLYRVVASSFVAGTPTHDTYVLEETDVTNHLVARIDNLEEGPQGAQTVYSAVPGNTVTMDPLTASSSASGAHGLGAEPDFVNLHLVCKTAGDGGYAVGDVVVMEESSRVSVSWDATNLQIAFAPTNQNVRLAPKAGGSPFNATMSRWKIEAIPYKIEEKQVGGPGGAAIDDLTNRVTALEGRVTTAESDITSVEGDVSTAETNISNLTTRVSTAEADVNAAETDIDDLETQVGNFTLQTISQSDYDALATKGANTIYLINA